MRSIGMMVVLALLAGCAPYTRVQIGLAEQARRGVAMWQQREAERGSVVRAEFAQRRAELARAFDDDVRERPAGELSPQWVIEARKAYAAGLDVIARAESSEVEGSETERRNGGANEPEPQELLGFEWMARRVVTMVEGGVI